MKEVVFIRQNIEKWRQTEQTVEHVGEASPDALADAYIDVTSDLAFAQTHYPDSRITLYLNNLASALHNELYKNKREKWSRIVTFWTREMPDTIWEARRELLSSFLIFLASALIGVLSQWLDADFARFVMGDHYVEMTLDNIASGHPMGVYNSSEGTLMFVGITTNNVQVSFLVFALGALTSFASGWILFQNGLMMGTFQTFFAQHGLLWPSFLAIWLHGTLEISAIIVAGAAGLAMGNSLLFPGTYSRLLAAYGLPSRSQARTQDSHRHRAHLHCGSLHRELHDPPRGVARRHAPCGHPTLGCVYYLLLPIPALQTKSWNRKSERLNSTRHGRSARKSATRSSS